MIKSAKSVLFTVYRNWKAYNSLEYDPVEYLILDDKKIVYIVLSKSACTSIKTAIGNEYGIYGQENNGLDIHRHKEWNRAYGRLDGDIRFNYNFFTFVRNPFARIVSCYKDKIENAISGNQYPNYYFENYPIHISDKSSFKEFVQIIAKIPDYLADRHFKSQSFSIAKNKMQNLKIYKVEELPDSWNSFASLNGFSAEIDHLNSNLRNQGYKNYDEYYDTESMNVIYKRYNKDILNFGYKEEYQRLKELLSGGKY